MFRVHDTILSEDIATARFACDVSRCKGACCVVGDAGAPVGETEIRHLRSAYRLLREELDPKAVETVEEHGLVRKQRRGGQASGYELSCVDGKECVFVTYDEGGTAQCAIQKAYQEGRTEWEKPLSCHLFPVRLKRIIDFDYANYDPLDDYCSAGCDRGREQGIWLSEFLREPLIRRYGEAWYEAFVQACNKLRKEKEGIRA